MIYYHLFIDLRVSPQSRKDSKESLTKLKAQSRNKLPLTTTYYKKNAPSIAFRNAGWVLRP